MANEETKPLKVIDYIDRFQVLELLKRYADLFAEPPVDRKELELVHEIKFKIEMLKSEDVKEVKHGEWIDTGDEILDTTYSGWKCSECGYIFCGDKFKFCPECGAKMDGGKADGKED